MDLVAANWGRNTQYQPALGREVRAYFGDWDTNGTVEILETAIDSGLGRETPFRTRDALGKAWPSLLTSFPTRRAFGEATVTQILGRELSGVNRVEVSTLDSVALLNRGDHWLVRPLPLEAQLDPAFGVVAADFDGDGQEDIFLSQNFFATNTETDRHDAGAGLLLRGDGRGSLQSLSAKESGISIPGEQRGAAAADFDADGRIDLAVTQNGAATQLFRNVRAKPGLRVRLRGPAKNSTGIGVQLRLRFPGGRFGPVREIHAGSGYWSQDSPVSVLGGAEAAEAILVRWPGREPQVVPIPIGAHEVEAFNSGDTNVIRPP
jgi:hypothetical protein